MTSGQTTPQIRNKLESMFFSIEQPDYKVTLLVVEIIKEWINKYILLFETRLLERLILILQFNT